MAINEIIILSLITIFHVSFVVFAWKIGKTFESMSWNLIVFAFALLLISRIISFLILFGVLSYDMNWVLSLDTIYLPLIFWAMIFIGITRMYFKLKLPSSSPGRVRTASPRRVERKQEAPNERKNSRVGSSRPMQSQSSKPSSSGYLDLTR
jgi:hypothetical protein